MQKLLNGCEKIMLYVSAMSTFVLMLLTTADAGGRYLFNRPITGAYEITTNYLMIAGVFMAMSFGYREGAYIRVTFLVDRLPDKVKLVVNHIVQVISMLYGVLLIIGTSQQALRVIGDRTTLSSLDFVPLGPAYLIVPVGLFFMSVAMLLDIRKVKKGESPLFAEEAPTA
ncbi:MAG TPA: TRAP transporter small permease [Thermodesulfobacteriota bacterium]|nr:TRAP transporter small permease [Thermodesulfobacteriota bacterium]